MTDLPRQSWVEAEAGLLERERQAMAEAAPEMALRTDLHRWGRPVHGWQGKAPPWGGEREQPPGVDQLLAGAQLELCVFYPEAYPMVPAELEPLDPEVPIEVRGFTEWHVNPDGSLCTIQRADHWNPATDTAADLVRKASGWFIEYLLLTGDHIERMTEGGIYTDESLDPILAGFA